MNEDNIKVSLVMLQRELQKVIDEHIDRYKITYAEAMGVLDGLKMDLWYENKGLHEK